jgi:glyoxylase-like metal-dependent hydrolase (beta-lactamase superfamily II)
LSSTGSESSRYCATEPAGLRDALSSPYDAFMSSQTVQVGRFELISLPVQPESVRPVPQFFPSADLSRLEPIRTRLPAMFGGSTDELRFGQSLCLLRERDSGEVTLIDAGLPPTTEHWMLMDALIRLGIKSERVNRVFITHRDADHIGGLSDRRKRDGGITFRNARHVISRVEWNDFQQDAARREWLENNLRPIEQAGLLDIVETTPLGDFQTAPEFAPGLKALLTPGHRVGATSLLVEDQALLIADVSHAPFQVTHPEVSIVFDTDQILAAQTRAEVMWLAAEQGWLLHVPHTPGSGLGRVTLESDGRRYWQPV